MPMFAPPMTALLRPTTWLAASAVIALLMLALVHGLQRFGGYLPCELCLTQRVAVWTVLFIALAGLGLGRLHPTITPVAVVAVGVGFAAGAGLGLYHAGVEWKWWPGPMACTGGGNANVSAASVAALLNGTSKTHLVRCDEAALRIAGLSLAGWNALASAALSLTSVAVVARGSRR